MRAPASIAARYGAQVDRVEGRVVDVGHALVDRVAVGRGGAPARAAIADEVLGVAATAVGAARSSPWRPRIERRAELGDERRILAEALVGPTPAHVLRHGHDRREVPADARSRPSPRRSPRRSARPGRHRRPRPSPMSCGKIVAPTTLPCPWTASTPYRIGIPSRVVSAAAGSRRPSATSRPASFCGGDPPPPLSTEPRNRSATPCGWTEPCSSWVIWPIFSSMVISARRAAARATGDWVGSCQSTTAAGADEAGTGGVPGGALGGVGVAHATTATARSREANLTNDRRIGQMVTGQGTDVAPITTPRR